MTDDIFKELEQITGDINKTGPSQKKQEFTYDLDDIMT
jgi:hypothetical protein